VFSHGNFGGLFLKVREKWFPIALIVVVLFGYGVGKDRALRENERDLSKGEFHD
jgi:hypothetical protein